MNQQTLNYHTRLHDWYRQHSIQQDKQTTDARAVPKQTAVSSKELLALGVLTRDKLQFIDEWCSDVNRTMFSIKKKEASPLYRKCRLSAPIKAAMKDRLNSGARRVRSAEVFTLKGEWNKAPKVNVKGGELLANPGSGRNKSASHSDGREATSSSANLGVVGDSIDFCVTNSLDKTNNNPNSTMPRVNHDSFDRRVHPSVIKKSAKMMRSSTSPRATAALSTQSGNVKVKSEKKVAEPETTTPRAKSATVFRPRRELRDSEDDDHQERQGSAKTLPKSHKLQESGNGGDQNEIVSNAATVKERKRVISASQKSVRASTVMTMSVADSEVRGILSNAEDVDDNTRGSLPTFCGKCSGIYAGNAPPPPTPATCASCVHGITLNGQLEEGQQEMGPSNAQIQKELAQKLVQTEKVYNKQITNANIQLKQAENRVIDDAIHYTKEREIVRDGQTRSKAMALSRLNDDDFPDDADLSIQNCDNENDLSFDDVNKSALSDCERGLLTDKEDTRVENKINTKKPIPTVTIVADDKHDAEKADQHADEYDSMTTEDDRFLTSLNQSRGNRRMSIHFTYKPEVGNASISNRLLHFMSIDDCKQAMRYHPHKILEKHEVADSPLLMIARNFTPGDTFDGGDDQDTASSDGKGAMRISKGSTITTLPSSTANMATTTNKKQYKILFDPEDLNYYQNKRPSSLTLAKAFHTLIHDRTIMQRLESKGLNGVKTKAVNNVGSTTEGPKYKLINAALKKQMGEQMQAQCQQMVHRYQRKKSGIYSAKRQARTGTLSQCSDKSLSLDSLPSVKKGIWKESQESLQ